MYLDRVNDGFTGTFFQFYKQMFNGEIYDFGINTVNGGFPVFGNHLWFLILLFIFSLILIGPFVLLRREKSYNRLLKVTSFLAKPGMIFTLVLPIILAEEIHFLTGQKLPYVGGFTFYTFIIFYFIGFIIASDKNFKEAIEKQIIPALIASILSLVALITLVTLKPFELFSQGGLTVWDGLYWIIYPICGWSILILLLGLGSKYLNKENRARKFMNELVLPFFILHQTVIVVIGFFVVELSIPLFAKFLIISFSSLAVIIVLLLIIKYLNPLRVLFGMRWKKDLLRRKPKAETTSQAEEISQVTEDETYQEK